MKIGTWSVEQQLTTERKLRREDDIANNLNVSHNRVHKSKKDYTRKTKHKGREF